MVSNKPSKVATFECYVNANSNVCTVLHYIMEVVQSLSLT